MYVRPRVPSGQATPSKAWAYIGSANCSESAWGKLFFVKSTKTPKLNCRNWECGVVIPMPPNSLSSGDHGEHLAMLDCFRGIVPVPIQLPAVSLELRLPWFFMKDMR